VIVKTLASVLTYLFWCNIHAHSKSEETRNSPSMRNVRFIALTTAIITAVVVLISLFIPEMDLVLYYMFPACWLVWAVLFISQFILAARVKSENNADERIKEKEKEIRLRHVWFTLLFGLLCHTYPFCRLEDFPDSIAQIAIFSAIFFCLELVLLILPEHGAVIDTKNLFTTRSPTENPLIKLLAVFTICIVSSLGLFLAHFTHALGLEQTLAYARSGMELIIIFSLFGTGLLFRQWSKGYGFHKMYISWLLPFIATLFILTRFTLPTWGVDSLISLTPTLEILAYLVGFASCFAILNESESIWVMLKRRNKV